VLKKLGNVFHRWGGRTAAFLSYTHLNHDMCVGLPPAMLPLIRSGLGLNYLQSGLLLSSFSITFGFSQFPGGWLGDRINRYAAVGIGVGGIGLTTSMVGLFSSYNALLILMVVMGLFAGPYHPSSTSMLSDFFGKEQRGKAIAFHMVGGSIGFAMSPILGGLLANWFGWRSAFIILGIPVVIASLLVFKKFGKEKSMKANLQTHDKTASRDVPEPITTGPKSIVQALRPIAFVTTLAISIQLVAGCAMAFIPIYLVDKHSIVPAVSAMLLGVIRTGGIAGSLFGGWLSDYWNRKNAILLSLVSTGPIFYLITRLPFNFYFMAVFFLFGLLVYMMQATIQPLIMDCSPPELRSTIFGIYFGLSMEGISLLQPVAGHFMDVLGIAQVFHIIALVNVALSIMALSLIRKPLGGQ